MYVNFLSTYSDKKSCHTSTTVQTSIMRFVSGCWFVSGSWASCLIHGHPSIHPSIHVYFSETALECQIKRCHSIFRHNVYNPWVIFVIFEARSFANYSASNDVPCCPPHLNYGTTLPHEKYNNKTGLFSTIKAISANNSTKWCINKAQ